MLFFNYFSPNVKREQTINFSTLNLPSPATVYGSSFTLRTEKLNNFKKFKNIILKMQGIKIINFINFINKISFMIGKLLYLSVIGRPILIVLLFILKVINFIKLLCFIFMVKNGLIKIPLKEPNLLLTEKEYVEKEINIFKKYIDFRDSSKQSVEKDLFAVACGEKCRKNENVDNIFYKMKEYNELMLSPNYLEKKWKNRTLIANTPQGNIIMYYDCYKRGFSYYSDQTNISYSLLNVVAMKYVKLYLCLDLFIDNKLIKKNNSPIIKLIENAEKEENKKKTKKFLKSSSCFLKNKKISSEQNLEEKQNTSLNSKLRNSSELSVENHQFAVDCEGKMVSKNKIYKKQSEKVINKNYLPLVSKENWSSSTLRDPLNVINRFNKDKIENKNLQKEGTLYSVNTFIYLGKIQNYSFLNLKEKTIIIKKEKINISYLDYKKNYIK